MISLGTGISPSAIPTASIGDPLKWGAMRWMWPDASNGVPATALLNLTMDVTAMAETKVTQSLLGDACVRGNVVLPEPVPLDAWQDVGKLEGIAADYMAGAEWAAIRAWVEANWT